MAAPQAPASTSTATAAAAPGANGPATAVSSGLTVPIPNRPLTLADVVAIAVGNNSGIVAARQRLQKAQELIAQVNAQGRPQIGADAIDNYSTYRTFPPVLAAPGIANPTLPGGGAIPPIVDAVGAFSGAFAGEQGSAGTGGSAITPGMSAAAPATSTAPSTAAPATSTAPATAPGASGAPSTTAPSTGGSTGTGTPATGSPAAPAPSTAAPAGGSSSTGNGTSTTAAVVPAIVDGYLTQRDSLFTLAESSAPIVNELPIQPASPSHSDGAGTGEGSRQPAAKTANPQPDLLPNQAGSSSSSAGNPQYNNFLLRLQIAQYLDVFGLLGTARGAQENVRDFYAEDIPRIQNETALAAKNLFFNVLLALALVDTEQEQVRYAQENVRITQDRFQQGIVSNFDVLTAQTALSTAQQQLTAAEDQRDLAQASLAYLLGSDPDQPVTLVPPTLPATNEAVDLPQSINVAESSRPEILQAQDDIHEAQRLVKVAESGLYPAVGVVGSAYGASEASTSTPQNYADISAEVDLPLDDGGETRSKVRSAKVDVQAQDLALLQTKQSVSLEVRAAVINIRNAQAQVASATTGVTEAQEALRLARERYGAGLGTFLDVLNALAELALTRTNLSNAQFFYQSSLADLVRAMGGR